MAIYREVSTEVYCDICGEKVIGWNSVRNGVSKIWAAYFARQEGCTTGKKIVCKQCRIKQRMEKCSLQNKFNEETWNAYYEGKIEPFAIQLSLVMSNMTFSDREIACGNAITFSANRLQYASNATKLQVSTQLFDRALLNRNGVMDIWNMAHVEDGEKYYIRKEYTEVSELNNSNKEPKIIIQQVPQLTQWQSVLLRLC